MEAHHTLCNMSHMAACLALACAAAPVATDDSFAQNPTGPTKVDAPGVLANDQVPCGAQAVLTVTKPPSHGSVYLDDSGESTDLPPVPYSGMAPAQDGTALG